MIIIRIKDDNFKETTYVNKKLDKPERKKS